MTYFYLLGIFHLCNFYRTVSLDTLRVGNPRETKTMRSAIALAAAVALTLSSPLACAGGKKAPPADPRSNLVTVAKKSKGGWQSWCDIDPNCNGWAAWLAQK